VAAKFVVQHHERLCSAKARSISLVLPGQMLRMELWRKGVGAGARVDVAARLLCVVFQTGKLCIATTTPSWTSLS
jgi:hypothetical protein